MIFTLHNRYLLTPAQIFRFSDKYSKLGYIKITDTRIEMTNDGRQFIMGTGLAGEEINVFEKIPLQFINNQAIKINEFYVPIKFKLDRKKFTKIFEEKEG